MSKIGNKELARVLMEKHGLDKAAAERFVEQMFDVLGEGLQTDKMVKVKGLGTFKVTSVASRKSVDVNTGEPIIIEGRDKISFTPDNSMRDQVNRPFAQFDTVVLNEGVDFAEIDERFADSMYESDGQGSDETSSSDLAEAEATDCKKTVESSESVAGGSLEIPAVESAVSVETEAMTAELMAAEAEPVVKVVSSVAQEPVDEAAEALPLTLSALQLDALNDSGCTNQAMEEHEQAVAEQAAEVAEPEAVGPVVEAKTGMTGKQDAQENELTGRPMDAEAQETETSDRYVEPLLHTTTPESAMHTDMPTEESYLSEIRNENMLLGEKVERQHRILKWFMGLSAVLVAGLVIAGLYLYGQLEKRDNRIRHLEAEAILVAQTPAGKAALKALVDSDAVRKAHDDSVTAARQLEAIEAANRAERQALAKAEAETRKQQAMTVQSASKSPKVAARPSVAGPKAKAKTAAGISQPSTTSTTAQKQTDKPAAVQQGQAKAALQQTDYNKDVRVRTGAYRITGVERTVTVRAGQTLSSISKANLGPGMECYIEAVNGGRREFKAGEKINIPALKLKKSR